MALFFQLAKIRRSPVPSTPSPSSSPWVFDIPEATRAILENLAEPLTVVSFFSYHRSIQDALCDAAATAAASASVIRNSYSSDTNNEQEQTNDTETTSTTSTTDIRLLGGGIWAWLSSPTSTMDSVSSSHPVHTLYVIYRHDNSISPNTLYDSTTENSAFSFPLHGILEPILALFSNQLNIVSPTIYDTEGDLARLARSLLTLQTTQRHYPPFDLPSLNWRWSDPVNRAISNSKAKSDHGHARGAATLEMYISDARKSTGVMSIESEDIAAQVAVLEQFFRSIKCCPSPASSKINNRAGGSIRKRRSKMNEQSIEAVLMRDLKDLTVTDTKKSNEAHIDSSWFHELTGRSKQRPDNQSTLTESQKATSGAVLYAKLQTYLTQLNGCSAPLNLSDLQQAARDAIRERALYNGAHTYHRIMNEHLDRQPIPLPWHTLAMLHHDAQSRSLEEIERRYYLGFEYYLPKLLGDFRTHCLKTTITDHASGKSAAATDANLVGATSALEMMVPTGGLYLEYYNANASALQNHHMVTLDEHWQVFKNRLLGNQRNSSSLASATVSPLTLRSSPDIKDYSDFLQAVDQVRRNYLETCIPSAEALSILENLDEMQQAESVIFLQSVANTAPNSALPTSPVTLSSHLKRCSSISSSTRQSLVLMNGSIGNIAGAGSASSADVLTDTLNGKSTSIQALASVNGNVDINSTSTSISRSATAQSLQQNEHAPTELEQQIAEIMMAKRRSKLEDNDKDSQDKELGSAGIESSSSTGNVDGSMSSDQKEHANSTVVQFGWTIHMLHANTLQYAWIWNWLYSHEGSSRQNVVACDSKTYTASKWIILPAKDIIRTRKDWKVKYGDRVWIISYWFSTRNTKIEMPEYLPRAQGAPCRHIVPYGETYVICKTCPADVLCMRCFRASDHADHTMYLQCSWGTSVCVCSDPSRLKMRRMLHCSLHSAESQKSYSGHTKGKPCQIKFKAGEKVYRCKSCATNANDDAVLCVRCFRSHNHFGHDFIAQLARDGSSCSCCDGKFWKFDLRCAYHSPGVLESEYLPRSIRLPSPSKSPWKPLPPEQEAASSSSSPSSPALVHSTTDDQTSPSLPPKAVSEVAKASLESQRCGHIFKPGEDIYHCKDCSFNSMVVLCGRCFHNSRCVKHRWRMGVFQQPDVKPRTSSELTRGIPAEESTREIAAEESTHEVPAEGEQAEIGITMNTVDSPCYPSDETLEQELPESENNESNEEELQDEAVYHVSCDCGDPTMFKTAFDCNYHLPQEFRPVPSLSHCNYLFERHESMWRCRTCHVVDSEHITNPSLMLDSIPTDDSEDEHQSSLPTATSDIWICTRCFKSEDHIGHEIEEGINKHNEGLYCHCGDPSILRQPPTQANINSTDCKDDHNRQTVLCVTDIKEGMHYYQCKTCQTDPGRVFCESCFIKEAHQGHSYLRLYASIGFETTRCGCGENSAFRFATHCERHERAGGTNIVHRCLYTASAGEWVAICSDCYPPQDGMAPPYLCLRCRQASDHLDHNVKWIKIEQDMSYPCACGSHSLSRLALSEVSYGMPSVQITAPDDIDEADKMKFIDPPSLCQYHTMIYKTTPSTTLYLHSHNHRSLNHQDHNEVTGYRYHDSNNDWIVTRPEPDIKKPLSPFLQWKDVFWLQHVNTGKYLNSMASLKINQGFQEVSAIEGPHSNNDWVVEETTWLRQQILSDE